MEAHFCCYVWFVLRCTICEVVCMEENVYNGPRANGWCTKMVERVRRAPMMIHASHPILIRVSQKFPFVSWLEALQFLPSKQTITNAENILLCFLFFFAWNKEFYELWQWQWMLLLKQTWYELWSQLLFSYSIVSSIVWWREYMILEWFWIDIMWKCSSYNMCY